MTREEAIELLTRAKPILATEELQTAIDMAIEALPERNIAREIATILENERDMRVILQNAERPKGEWHKTENEEMEITGYYCSVCDMPTDEPTNYCGNCGADMRSEKEYLDKTFPEHEGGEWFDITDMMTGEGKEEVENE